MRFAFLHANGYPPGVYQQFFDALKHSLAGEAVLVAAPFLETAVNCKPQRRWPTMLGVAQQHVATARANVLIGHSMGGYLALQVAASRPGEIAAVILIDSPIPRQWRSGLLSFSKLTGLSYKFGPSPIAYGRRDRWPDRDAAHAHFASKHFVKRWAHGVLDDFIAHAMVDDGDGVTLTIARNTEAQIYATIVHEAAFAALAELRAQGTPVYFIAGAMSDELRLAGRNGNRALFAPNYVELDDVGHLIPMEAPERCAIEVAQIIKAESISR